MSDTTITAEERARWRKRFDSPFFDKGCKPFSLRALDALEDSERRVSELTALLGASCEETRQSFSALYKTATEVIPALNAKIEQAESHAEKAESNVARLTKERDWLADKLAEQNICRATHNKDKTISLRAIDADEWAEAARRAVAAGEE